MEISINWLAVLVAGIVNMVVGALWYGPLFGKKWQSLMGLTPESMQSMKMTAKKSMIFGFIIALIMAYVLAHFTVIAGAMGASGALNLAFWIWLGFIATNSIGSYLWEGKPFSLFVLNAVEQLVAIILMTLVLVMW